jgi:hypothetical protein
MWYKNAELYIDLPYYADLENIYLQAKLMDDEDSKWVNIKNDRIFRLGNLEPGKYNLMIRFYLPKTGNLYIKCCLWKWKRIFIRPLSLKFWL